MCHLLPNILKLRGAARIVVGLQQFYGSTGGSNLQNKSHLYIQLPFVGEKMFLMCEEMWIFKARICCVIAHGIDPTFKLCLF